MYKKNPSTSEEHEAITNIIESLPLHTKKSPKPLYDVFITGEFLSPNS
jgi:hypothetical protein